MVFISHLLSLMKSIHMLAGTDKYQYHILASLILEACYRYIVFVAGPDPGFGIRGGGVSRRGIWGPLKVPSGSREEP